MVKNQGLFIGIDVQPGSGLVCFVVLDETRKVEAIGGAGVADALAYAAGIQGTAWMAVTVPAAPNHGRMQDEEIRESLTPPPKPGHFTHLRQAEYEIIASGGPAFQTADSNARTLVWQKRGFLLSEGLKELGYANYSADSPETHRLRAETCADAIFWSLLGHAPLSGATIEGRIQRQLVLKDLGLPVPDAMDYFEEVTRFRILKGELPMQFVLPLGEINAYAAAYTAWLIAHDPNRIQNYGDAEEGIISLPLPALR